MGVVMGWKGQWDGAAKHEVGWMQLRGRGGEQRRVGLGEGRQEEWDSSAGEKRGGSGYNKVRESRMEWGSQAVGGRRRG